MTEARERFHRDSDLAFRVLAGEAVLIDPRRREVHVLNETGTRVWELLAEPLTLGELTRKLLVEFDAEAAAAFEDEVEAFVTRLLERGLILAK